MRRMNKNTTKIMDTCFNSIHNPLHDPHPHQETRHPTNLVFPPRPPKPHPHLEVLS